MLEIEMGVRFARFITRPLRTKALREALTICVLLSYGIVLILNSLSSSIVSLKLIL